MKKILNKLIIHLGVLFYAQLVLASDVLDLNTVVSSGLTVVASETVSPKVEVHLTTKEIDIGPRVGGVQREESSLCTMSKAPCSLTVGLKILVDNKALFIPKSVFLDLADLQTIQLIKLKKDSYQVKMVGGDASETYTVNISFTTKAVTARRIIAEESHTTMEYTKYFIK